MNDILPTLESWTASGERIALATVVRTVGSSLQRVGARMAVTATGGVVGSVSGGCVEGAVTEEALDALRTGEARLLEFGVSDEEAWAVGLSCGGIIEVFVEPMVSFADHDVVGEFIERVRTYRPVALATAVAGPSAVGSRLLVDDSGALAGSLQDGDRDRAAIEQCLQLLGDGRSEVVTLGEHRVFVDVKLPPPRLVIVGAVHIAVTLGRFARELGFRVVVTDARGRFATKERFPDADELILGWPNEVLPRLALDRFSYVVVVSHDAKLDNPALLTALESPAPYVGALGSRKTHARRVKALEEAGLSADDIRRIHAPIGLDLGARTPQEIALAIMAQIVAVRNGLEGAGA